MNMEEKTRDVQIRSLRRKQVQHEALAQTHTKKAREYRLKAEKLERGR